MSAGTISLLKEPQHMAPAVLLILESTGEREVDGRCGGLLGRVRTEKAVLSFSCPPFYKGLSRHS